MMMFNATINPFRRLGRALLALVLAAQWLVAPAFAAGGAGVWLPAPGRMVGMSAAGQPALLRGLTFDPADPLAFDFLIDAGDSGLSGEALKEEAGRLIRYFMTALTVPDDDLWVNLSPYEKDRIIPDPLSRTEMGRDLLAQDYLLKQVAASLMYPEGDTGQAFWSRVYGENGGEGMAAVGPDSSPVETFSKVWVMPDFAEVYEDGDTALILDSRLRVMTEADFLAREGATAAPAGPAADRVNTLLREVMVPAVEQEVNAGENFSRLRQMYHALVLAAWFKRHLRDHVLSKIYVGKNKTGGIDPVDPGLRDRIYERYLAAFRQGVYNYVKEDVDAAGEQVIPRRYFSGGGRFSGQAVSSSIKLTRDPARPRGFWTGLQRLGRGIFSARTRIEPAPAPVAGDPQEGVIAPSLRESFRAYLADRRRLFDANGRLVWGREIAVRQPLRSMIAVRGIGGVKSDAGDGPAELAAMAVDGLETDPEARKRIYTHSRFSLETYRAGHVRDDPGEQFAVLTTLNRFLRPGYSYHYQERQLRNALSLLGKDARDSNNYSYERFRHPAEDAGEILIFEQGSLPRLPPEDLVFLVHARAYNNVEQAIRQRLAADGVVDVEAAFAAIRQRMFVYDFSGLGEEVPDNQLDLAIGWLAGTAEGQRRFQEMSGVDLQAVYDQVMGGHLLNRFDQRNIFLGWDYVDPQMAELDAMTDPDELHQAVKNQLWARGISPEIRGSVEDMEDTGLLNIALDDHKGDERGRLKGKVDFGNEVIVFDGIWLDRGDMRGQRIFPLLYRWFASHPDLRDLFRDYDLRVENTTPSSAKAWMRSGFDHPRAVILTTEGSPRFRLEARFPDWQARAGKDAGATIKTEHDAPVAIAAGLSIPSDWRQAEELVILDQPEGQQMVTARYTTLDTLRTEADLNTAIESLTAWRREKEGDTAVTRGLLRELRARRNRLWEGLPLVDSHDTDADRLFGDLRLAVDGAGRVLGYVRFGQGPDGWMVNAVEVAPADKGRGLGLELFAAGLAEGLARGEGKDNVGVVMIASIFLRQITAALPDYAGTPGTTITLTPDQVRTYLAYHDNRVRERMDAIMGGAQPAASSPVAEGERHRKGGVDFNAQHLDLRTAGPGMTVDLPALEALVDDPSFTGFRPVVVELVPVTYGQGLWGM